MLDKGEKHSVKERMGNCKKGMKSFFGGTKRFLKGKGNIFLSCVVIIMMIAMFVQNSGMISDMKKIMANAEGNVHEIYDDTAVVQAYLSGNADGLNSEDTWLLEKVTSVIKEVIKDDMTVYEKEKAIYDWLFAYTHYNDENLNPINDATGYDSHTPYDVLHSHSAICVGNATTFKLFMGALEIPCKIIHSTENGEHAWDIVQMDDGEWYHVDVTFDAGSNAPAYSMFNVPDTVKDDGNWPWDHSEIPAAKGYKYCYIYENAVECEDIYDIPEAIQNAIDAKEPVVAFYLKDRKHFTGGVAEYLANAFYVENGGMHYNNAMLIGDRTIYTYNVSYNSENEEGNLDEEIISKLQEIIQSINGGAPVEYIEEDSEDVITETING